MAALLAQAAPELTFANVFGKEELAYEIDLGYNPSASGGADYDPVYAQHFLKDTEFSKQVLQVVPARFVAQVLWDTVPTQEDLKGVLRKIKSILEKNDFSMAYYDVILLDKNASTRKDSLAHLVDLGLVETKDIPIDE